MAKWLAGIIRLVAVILILGLLGYNTFQIAALKAEIAALKAENRLVRSDPGSRDATRPENDAMSAARHHMERAQALLKQGKFAEARREAGLAAEVVRRTTEAARAGGEDTLRGLRTEIDELSREAETLWKRHGGAKIAP